MKCNNNFNKLIDDKIYKLDNNNITLVIMVVEFGVLYEYR